MLYFSDPQETKRKECRWQYRSQPQGDELPLLSPERLHDPLAGVPAIPFIPPRLWPAAHWRTPIRRTP
jgi:hypothetical protein